MKLHVYNSNSSGNAYLLDNGMEALLLECGIPFKRIMADIGKGVSRLAGCVLSHEHGDHAKSVEEIISMRLTVVTSEGTREALFGEAHPIFVRCIQPQEETVLGGFSIIAIPTEHDAKQPYGYIIRHDDMGTLLFATDTYYLRYRFKGLNHIMVECNYDHALLMLNYENGRISLALKERTIKSHMSLDTCSDVVTSNDSPKLRNVVLLHLSEENSDEEAFRKHIQGLTRARVTVARPGVELELKKDPF